MDEWISVKDKLPTPDEAVIVRNDKDELFLCLYKRVCEDMGQITHWKASSWHPPKYLSHYKIKHSYPENW